MDERAGLGVGAGERRAPELPAEEDRAEAVREHEREHVLVRAPAVVPEPREVVRADPAEVVGRDAVARGVEEAEPCGVAARAGQGGVVGEQVREGPPGVDGGQWGGGVQGGLLCVRAAVEGRALLKSGGGDCKGATGELGDVRVGGREDLGDVVVGVDDVEEVGRFDGVCVVPGVGEVVRRRDCEEYISANVRPLRSSSGKKMRTIVGQ